MQLRKSFSFPPTTIWIKVVTHLLRRCQTYDIGQIPSNFVQRRGQIRHASTEASLAYFRLCMAEWHGRPLWPFGREVPGGTLEEALPRLHQPHGKSRKSTRESSCQHPEMNISDKNQGWAASILFCRYYFLMSLENDLSMIVIIY